MLLRIWRVAIAPGKSAELESFAREHSLPMFREQPGCLGVFFTRTTSDCATLTLWSSPESVHRMESSERYRRVVEAIEASGILGDDHRTEVLTIFGGHADAELSGLLTAAWDETG